MAESEAQVRFLKVEAQTCEVTASHRPRPVCVEIHATSSRGSCEATRKGHGCREGENREKHVTSQGSKYDPYTSWVGQGQADQTPWSSTSDRIAVGSRPKRAWSEGSATPHLQSTEAPAMSDELLGLKID